MKWIYNRNLIKVFNDLGEQLHNDVLEMSDVDLFEDRIKCVTISFFKNVTISFKKMVTMWISFLKIITISFFKMCDESAIIRFHELLRWSTTRHKNRQCTEPSERQTGCPSQEALQCFYKDCAQVLARRRR